MAPAQGGVSAEHDSLVARLRAVKDQGEKFGAAYAAIYRVIIPWYEKWGGRNTAPVDDWAVSPDKYAAELADALEHGHNFVAEHLGSGFPALFERKMPNGDISMENYQLHLPSDFPGGGRKYPLTIGLPGSGWIAHKISYSEGGANTDAWISVTPILEGRDWQIKFLNDYLDELIRILPVDADKVYVSGHSLGGMATWNWAESNPERFAAIAPEDGFGQPYRAIRLKYVPVWAIHGEKDDVIFPGLAEQMVSAVRAVGGTALYSNLKGAPHNVPEWFNWDPVIAWYMSHTRSHRRPPADPRDGLGIGREGFSGTDVLHLPAGMYWKSEPVSGSRLSTRGGKEAAALFDKVQGRGAIVDSPVWYEVDTLSHVTTAWLAVPLELQTSSKNDPSMVSLPARDVVRFYFVGSPQDAVAHALGLAGRSLSTKVWISPLGPEKDNSQRQIYECRCEILSGSR